MTLHILKGHCHEIFNHVFCKILSGPNRNRQKRFHKLFAFTKFKNCVSWHPNFSLDTNVFIFLNYCFWVCKHTQEPFSADCSFKICDYANTVSAWSTITPTLCLRSQCVSAKSTTTPTWCVNCECSKRLRGQGVSIVNHYLEQFSKISNYILCYFFL